MMTLVLGGSGSGKSAYAEDYLVSLSAAGQNYYIATMQVYDAEGEQKIARHRSLRSGKGFITIEQPVDIGNAAGKMHAGDKNALLECISNLTANEMFSGREPEQETVVAERVIQGIEALRNEVSHLVIVSNNVFEDGMNYDETTTAYIRAMGKINVRLSAMADEVVEVVVGIPLRVKSRSGSDKEKEKGC